MKCTGPMNCETLGDSRKRCIGRGEVGKIIFVVADAVLMQLGLEPGEKFDILNEDDSKDCQVAR